MGVRPPESRGQRGRGEQRRTLPRSTLLKFGPLLPVTTEFGMPEPRQNLGFQVGPPMTELAKLTERMEAAQQTQVAKIAEQIRSATWTPKSLGLEAQWMTSMERYFQPMSTQSMAAASFQKVLDDQAKRMEQMARRMVEATNPVRIAMDQMARSFQSSPVFNQSLLSEQAARAIQDAVHRPMLSADVLDSIEKLQTGFKLPAEVSRVLATLDHAARESASLTVEPADRVDTIQREQAAARFEALVQETAEAPTAIVQLETIIAAIKATQDTPLQKVLWFILIPMLMALLWSMVNPVMDFYIKKRLEEASSRQEANKVVKEQVREAMPDAAMRRDYRFVSMPAGKVLTVRASAGARAARVGELRTGQVVHVVERAGAFTLVEWRSDDGSAAVKGWVFSRYLERFK